MFILLILKKSVYNSNTLFIYHFYKNMDDKDLLK